MFYITTHLNVIVLSTVSQANNVHKLIDANKDSKSFNQIILLRLLNLDRNLIYDRIFLEAYLILTCPYVWYK